ncbi:MAG: hypothetical protein EXS03_04255 [Phycisphaerales bacterium]|nr:hypothetical protein [Phycisphaerales bacterium]
MQTFWSRRVGRSFVALAVSCASFAVVGCASATRDYPGVTRDALWAAAVGAANHPQYTDWFVAENGVFVDEAELRIEIHRELKRDHAPPGAALRRESETWSLSVRLDMDDRIPKVCVDSRAGIKSRGFKRQADHFFSEIDSRLAQVSPKDAGATVPAAEAPGPLQAP